jgi:hypothetical protein
MSKLDSDPTAKISKRKPKAAKRRMRVENAPNENSQALADKNSDEMSLEELGNWEKGEITPKSERQEAVKKAQVAKDLAARKTRELLDKEDMMKSAQEAADRKREERKRRMRKN